MGIPTVVVGLCTYQAFEEEVEVSLPELSFIVGLFQENVGTLRLGRQSLGSPSLTDYTRELLRRLDRGQEAGDNDDWMRCYDEGVRWA